VKPTFTYILQSLIGLALATNLSLVADDNLIRLGDNGPQLKRTVIDEQLPGAYQVEIADVNGDGSPDIVALGGGTVAWYQNPGWSKHIVSHSGITPGVISTATADIDGDGKAEIAIAYEFEMNQPRKGQLLLARQDEGSWTFEKLGAFPSIHRLRWGDFNGDRKRDLLIAPIFGETATAPKFQEQGADLTVLFSADPQEKSHVDRKLVTHAVCVIHAQDNPQNTFLCSSNEGVWRYWFENQKWMSRKLFAGASGERPKTGSSEIHQGHFADGRVFYTTIEPWHGTNVVLTAEKTRQSDNFQQPVTLDNSLVDGHALCVADIDGDGTDEIFAGFRGAGTSVRAYRLDSGVWKTFVIDSRIAAQDLRSADINGDGLADVVSVGGSTKNVVLYESVRKSQQKQE
jgi:hypothetical protein